MRIGVDMDDVLAELMLELNNYYNDKYNSEFELEDYKTYGLSLIWGCTQKEAIDIVMDFYKSKYFKKIKPTPGSQECIQKLSENNSLYLVTSRVDEIRDETIAWINQFFPKLFDEIYLTNAFNNGSKKAINKSEVCKRLNLEIFVEDATHYLLDCMQVVSKGFLINKPWNRNSIDLPPNIKRVDNWHNILEEIH